MKKRYLFFLWEFPQLFLALLFYLILKSRITYRFKYGDVQVYYTENFPGGISLSFIVFLNEKYKGNITAVRHEYGHTLQSLYLGWLYLIIVGIPSLIRAIIWNKFKLESKKYYLGYPENWANKLGRRKREKRILEFLK